MQVLIDHQTNAEQSRYGFSAIADILGLDFEIVGRISDAKPLPVLIYYGRTLPKELLEKTYEAIFHILPSDPLSIIDGNVFFGDTHTILIPFAFGSKLGSVVPEWIVGKSETSVFAGWVDQKRLCCSIDFPLSVSYLLSLEHERDQRADELGRPIGPESWIYQNGLSNVPVADRLIAAFWMLCCCAHSRAKALLVRKIPWPNRRKFCMPVSHDIDLVQRWTVNAVIKEGMSILSDKQKRHLQYATQTLRSVASSHFNRKTDPYWNFNQIISLEKKYDISSTFFFLTHRKHHRINSQKMVGNYGRMSKNVASLMKELYDNGFEIGLHGSIDAFKDGHILEAERNQIESCLNGACNGIRQHFLLFDRDRTPLDQLKAGFQYDSTLGYRDICGYRCGTGFPYSWFNLFMDGKDKFLEIPLIVMDSSLVLERKGDLKGCYERLFDLLRQGLNQGSCMTLLWHNTSFSDPSYPWLRQLFEDALSFAQENDGWVTNISSLCQWWLQRRKMKLQISQSDRKSTINIIDPPSNYTFGLDVFVPEGMTYEFRGPDNFKLEKTGEIEVFKNHGGWWGKMCRLYVHPS